MIHKTVALLSFLSLSTAEDLFSSKPEDLKVLWERFKTTHGKSYSTMEEESSRYETFVRNLQVIDERNRDELAAGGNAVHGVTHLSDLSQEEFRQRFLLSDPKLKTGNAEVAEVPPYSGSSSSKDWTGVYTTAVKDQGYCGSCWAFSATEQIESDAIRTLGASTSISLSAEQITQCASTSYGCNGGWTESAYNYVKSTGGIETEAVYPYTSYYGTTGSCHSKSSEFVYKVNGYSTINGETNMANYVLSTGPLSVCLDANNWNTYNGGIMTVCGHSVDHCVQAVGVDTSSNGYWKVRNSWGTSWGEDGYIRLAYGSNTCDITNDPTYTSVANA